ncbi:MAG: hypothetical protein CL942_16040 [Desulfovibrio sp.]|nr:hypothetical protein [Desulfovibrio sp.]
MIISPVIDSIIEELTFVAIGDGESVHHTFYPGIMLKIHNLGIFDKGYIYVNGAYYDCSLWNPILEAHDFDLLDIRYPELEKDMIDVSVGTDTGCKLSNKCIDGIALITSDTANIFVQTRIIDSGMLVATFGKDDANDKYVLNSDIFYYTNASFPREGRYKESLGIKRHLKLIRLIRIITVKYGNDGWINDKILDQHLRKRGYDWSAIHGYEDMQSWLEALGGFTFRPSNRGNMMARADTFQPTIHNKNNLATKSSRSNRMHPPNSKRKRCIKRA